MNRFGIEQIHHLAIAVANIEKSLELWKDKLGFVPDVRDFPELKMREAAFYVGEVQIQIYQSTEPGLRFSKWVEENGEGLHHVCFQVTDLAKTVEACQAAGLAIVEPAPVSGSQGIHQRLTDEAGQGLELEFLQVHPHLLKAASPKRASVARTGRGTPVRKKAVSRASKAGARKAGRTGKAKPAKKTRPAARPRKAKKAARRAKGARRR